MLVLFQQPVRVRNVVMQLVAINGPLAGTALELADGLRVEPPAEASERSRPSCRVRSSPDGAFVLHALDPHALVFVNGLPVTNRALQPGDEVRLGDSLFIARHDECVSSSPLSRCGVSLTSLHARRVFELGFEEAVLHLDGTTESRGDHDLALLMRSGAALSSVRGLASVDAALAGFILDIVPAQRIVFAEPDDPAPVIRSAWTASRKVQPPVAVDPELLRHVIHDRRALVIEFENRCAVVAPMMAFGRATGAVWAEAHPGIGAASGTTTRSSSRPSATIDKGHVRLLLVVTALAAVAREQSRETARLQETRELLQAEINLEHNMVGRSKPMRALFDRIARVAPDRGDGSAARRERHRQGARRARRAPRTARAAERPVRRRSTAPRCRRRCSRASCSGTRRARSPARSARKKGKFEPADGGTLFLDEIGEMPLRAAGQAAARAAGARVRARRRHAGRSASTSASSPPPTATSMRRSQPARFREDLYYRLNVVTLALPPLRERTRGHPAARRAISSGSMPSRCGRRRRGISRGRAGLFLKHDWPGNVRELENVIEQALVLGSGDQRGGCRPSAERCRRRAGVAGVTRLPRDPRANQAGADRAGIRAGRTQSHECRTIARRAPELPAPAPSQSGSAVASRHAGKPLAARMRLARPYRHA